MHLAGLAGESTSSPPATRAEDVRRRCTSNASAPSWAAPIIRQTEGCMFGCASGGDDDAARAPMKCVDARLDIGRVMRKGQSY